MPAISKFEVEVKTGNVATAGMFLPGREGASLKRFPAGGIKVSYQDCRTKQLL